MLLQKNFDNMRLFIAVECPREIEVHLLELQKFLQADYAKITLTSSLHLTVKFLGDVPEKKIIEINSTLSKIKYERFFLTLDKLGVFPNENHINVVWIGLKEHTEINNLQRAVEESLIEIFPKERFHPHITLGRVKFVRDKERFLKLIKDLKVRNLSFSVDKFKLYQSILTAECPKYFVVKEFELS